jgi:hypothetical protein
MKSGRGDSQDLPVRAQVDTALPAGRTLVAVNGRIESDSVSCGHVPHAPSDRLHDPACLMAHDDGRNPSPGCPGVAVDVGAADGNGLDPNQDLVIAKGRFWNIPVFELEGRSVNQGFHECDLQDISKKKISFLSNNFNNII